MSIEKNINQNSHLNLRLINKPENIIVNPNFTLQDQIEESINNNLKTNTNKVIEQINEKKSEIKIGENGSPSSNGVKINLMLNINFNVKGSKVNFYNDFFLNLLLTIKLN